MISFFRSFISFFRSFISPLRGECSFPTEEFANPSVGIFPSLPWNFFVPRVETLFSNGGTIRGKGIRERIAGK